MRLQALRNHLQYYARHLRHNRPVNVNSHRIGADRGPFLRARKGKLIREKFRGKFLAKILGKLRQWLPPFGTKQRTDDERENVKRAWGVLIESFMLPTTAPLRSFPTPCVFSRSEEQKTWLETSFRLVVDFRSICIRQSPRYRPYE